jgi:hypothetical protein
MPHAHQLALPHQNIVCCCPFLEACYVLNEVLAPGDRSHIPESARPTFNVISEQLNRLRQTAQVIGYIMCRFLDAGIDHAFDVASTEAACR